MALNDGLEDVLGVIWDRLLEKIEWSATTPADADFLRGFIASVLLNAGREGLAERLGGATALKVAKETRDMVERIGREGGLN